MRQKQWLVVSGMVMAAGLATALGMTGGSSANEPVRVYLVHSAEHPERGQSSTSRGSGITVFQTVPGATWPTQVLGYLDDVDEDWVVLRKATDGQERLEIRIPRERVQLIEHISDERLRALLTPG